MRFIYSALSLLLIPFAFFRLWRKGKKLPAYRERWAERLGKTRKVSNEKPIIWFHTVSVGEFIAARPLIQHYLENGSFEVLITCTTPTGSERIRASFAEKVHHCYLPYDIGIFVNRFLNVFKPAIFICLETELWPNLIHACKKRRIPIVLANARLSEKSARGYAKFSRLTNAMLSGISAAAIQNDEDASRFILLGLDEQKSHSIGNIKFDLELDNELRLNAANLKEHLQQAQNSKIWIAASTHRGEDEIILAAYTSLKVQHPELKLIIVPRHPERFDDVYQLCLNTGFQTLRRSKGELADFDVLLGDTMGELLLLFGASDFAFIGGSLVENGGHNYIEPAAWALPLLSGPSTYNFRETAKELIEHEALIIANSSEELASEIHDLLTNPERFKQMGESARMVAEKNRGALARLINLIDQTIKNS